MCLHRFYVAPLEAAQSGHLTSNRQGSSSTAQGARECKVESHKMHNRGYGSGQDWHTNRFQRSGTTEPDG